MRDFTENKYLQYCLAMAFADGLLDPVKQARYVRNMERWFEELDIEEEYEAIQRGEKRLSAALRRRGTALVEYERDKARLGPGSVKEGHAGLFM